MSYWVCRLSDISLERFEHTLGLTGINNEVAFHGEYNLPRSHARQVAADAFRQLARQNRSGLDRAELHQLIEGLDVLCDSVRP